MGSWSESCGFSGIEIGEREVAYVMLIDKCRGSLNDGAFIHYAPTTTLLRGTYNDYGYLRVEDSEEVLAVFNQQSGLALKNGDDFSLEDLNGKSERRWWMHGGMFDFMPTIKQDFPYFSTRRGGYKSVKVKNIGDCANGRIKELQEAHDEGRQSFAKDMEAFKGHGDSDALIEAVLTMSRHSLRELFGYGSDVGGYHALFQQALKDNVENIDGLLEAYRRTYLVGYALIELRKTLAPNESCGPQHGGEEASCQFARSILAIQKQRKTRWD